MGLEAFEEQVRRYLKTDVWNVEQGQGGIDLIALEMDLLREPECKGVTNVDTASYPIRSAIPALQAQHGWYHTGQGMT